jgi:hypothetical protein
LVLLVIELFLGFASLAAIKKAPNLALPEGRDFASA